MDLMPPTSATNLINNQDDNDVHEQYVLMDQDEQCDAEPSHFSEENDVVVSRNNNGGCHFFVYYGRIVSKFFQRDSFAFAFLTTNGPLQVVIIGFMFALGSGSTVGIVPQVMTDRFARLRHHYSGDKHCSEYTMTTTSNNNNYYYDDYNTTADFWGNNNNTKPQACLDGSADAQNAIALIHFVDNMLKFLTGSLLGSLSDQYGRRVFMILGMFMKLLPHLFFVIIQLRPRMSPWWHYAMGPVSAVFHWNAVALSSLPDAVPPKWRAASFGVAMAGIGAGACTGPLVPVLLKSRLGASIFHLSIGFFTLLVTIAIFPETLRPETRQRATMVRWQRLRRSDSSSSDGSADSAAACGRKVLWYIWRPLWELSILNRNHLFRVVALLVFVCGLVSAGNTTLLIYYVEERLGFNDIDIATMAIVCGVVGITVQGLFLKHVTDRIGEKGVVIAAVLFGAFSNILFGMATTKPIILLGGVTSSFASMGLPAMGAINANNVDESEQGRIQGALASLEALASATGPLLLRFVYYKTKDNPYPGPGWMFLSGSGLLLVVALFAFTLPEKQANSSFDDGNDNENHNEGYVPIINSSVVATETTVVSDDRNNATTATTEEESNKSEYAI